MSTALVPEQPISQLDELIFDPQTTHIRFVSRTVGGLCFVTVSPFLDDEQGIKTNNRIVVVRHVHSGQEDVADWNDNLKPGWVDETPFVHDSLRGVVVEQLASDIRAHLAQPTTIFWECKKCGYRAAAEEDHHLRMVGKLCSQMGRLEWLPVDEPLISEKAARKRRAIRLRADGMNWARIVVKIRSTSDLILNIEYEPNNPHRLMALYQLENQTKRPRADILTAIHDRLERMRPTMPLLLQLQTMTTSDLEKELHIEAVKASTSEQIQAALDQLEFELENKAMVSLLDSSRFSGALVWELKGRREQYAEISIIYPKVSMEPYRDGQIIDIQLENELVHELAAAVEKSAGRVEDLFYKAEAGTGQDARVETSKPVPVKPDFYQLQFNPQLSLFGED